VARLDQLLQAAAGESGEPAGPEPVEPLAGIFGPGFDRV